MSISKAQQSFSSYSQQENNEPHPSEDDKFSEYEEQIQQKMGQLDQVNEAKSRPVLQKRRYSYGRIEQKPMTYNYLNSFNDFAYTRPAYIAPSIKNLKQSKYIKGVCSPCGVGAFQSSALQEYEKCYLSGLSKYYKSHNYNNKRQTRAISSVSSSVNKSQNLDRSEYWNGQKFEYLIEKQLEKKQRRDHNSKQVKNIEFSQSFERNMASGLIVNKKHIMQGKLNQSGKLRNKRDQSSYIKIEEDFSNSKKCSQVKRPAKQRGNLELQKTQDPLLEHPVKSNQELLQKNQQSDIKFQSIQVTSKQQKLIEKQYSTLLTQKNQLAKQNDRLRQRLIQTNAQIQRIAKQRIKDNEDYTQKIDKLKALFENQRNSLIKNYQAEISIYKSVRKQAIKNQLIKEEEERLNLIIQKNRIQNQFRRVSQELTVVKQQLANKSLESINLQKSIRFLERQSSTQNKRPNEHKNKITQKQLNLPLKNQNEKVTNSHDREHQLPKWITNFITVFKNMAAKLIGQMDSSWSDKKVIIIGWKVIKILIQKAVKLGIKIPQVIAQNQIGQCSIICKNSAEVKKYNMTASKKPIRN